LEPLLLGFVGERRLRRRLLHQPEHPLILINAEEACVG
jgi:hypothetical protein